MVGGQLSLVTINVFYAEMSIGKLSELQVMENASHNTTLDKTMENIL